MVIAIVPAPEPVRRLAPGPHAGLHARLMDAHDAGSCDFRVGCAGWSIPSAQALRFPVGGSHLQRYAQVFDAVEINSSFYRSHRPATYARWAAAVPPAFRFAVKMPRVISHQARLQEAQVPLRAFLEAVGQLGPRLGCLLLQLPPSLAWDPALAGDFFARLRGLHTGAVACEPRHRSWFQPAAARLLHRFAIARVAADPWVTPRAAVPSGDRTFSYLRLHGSPRVYHDAYTPQALDALARRVRRHAARGTCWCIFDNTALGHATANALGLTERLAVPAPDGRRPGAAAETFRPATAAARPPYSGLS